MCQSRTDIDDDLSRGTASRYSLISCVDRSEIEVLLIELWPNFPCLHETSGFAQQLSVMCSAFTG